MFKLTEFLKPYRKECLVGPFFKLLEAILELLLPTIVALIVNHGIAKGDTSYVLRMGALMLAMSVLGFGCSMICQYYAARASQGFGTNLRNAMFRHISSLSYAELDRFGTPTLVNRITNDVNQLQLAVAMLIRLVIRAPFICIGAIAMSMILDFRLSLVLIAATPVIGIVLYFIITRTAPLYRQYQGKMDRLAQILSENLSGVRVIRAFAKSREERQRFKTSSDDIAGTAIRVGRIAALLNPATSLIVNGAIIAILWVGSLHIDAGSLSQGEIIAFINYVTQILLALIVVSNLVIIFTKAASSATRVSEVLAVRSSIGDATEAVLLGTASAAEAAAGGERPSTTASSCTAVPVASPTAVPDCAALAPEATGSYFATPGNASASRTAARADVASTVAAASVPVIAFRHVSFGYSVTGDLALTDINAEIGRGETVGIIGGTGSGKSTLIQLIPRFYDAVQGEVLVDGLNVREYPLSTLRRKIGLVPQKAELFSGTIAENIRWGKPDATDEQVAEAARIAQATEFISKLPEGMDTIVARGGKNLSGGQKQRLTIARAIAADPGILILDDSASALDFATDAALRRAIREMRGTKTVLIVSQRVSSIRYADRIIVLDEGQIAGIGTHQELLKTCGVYREVYQSQSSDGEAAG
ncbi:MAG: ATP-binding protein [Paenibacillaceae bacterium]|nr:ATP-binding protein [Paenibacillaceae bacterium]